MKRRSFLIHTFGCQMNLHDAERVSGILSSHGWEQTDSPEEAGAVILLSCCVRRSAEQRLLGRLSSLKTLKERNGTIIAVGGCLAQKEGDRLQQTAPHVDLVFGTHQYVNIADLLEDAAGGKICALDMHGFELDGLPCSRRERFRAWVTIIHGCDNYCSYCIVPYVRGPESSRDFDEVVSEVERHVSEGVKEVVLLGQNVNSFRRKEEGRSAFPRLLRCLGGEFSGAWLRFITSHPRDFDEQTIKAIAETPSVCEHVHLPMQAGSDRVLRGMRRGYTSGEYLDRVRILRDSVRGVSLSSDLIVGFPGESERDFQKTLEMVEECRFDYAYTFLYNPREGTVADSMLDDVSPEDKRERLGKLTKLTNRLTALSLMKEVGSEQVVLVNGTSSKDAGRWSARTRNNKIVHFPVSGYDLTGRFVRVGITSSGNWALEGEQLEVLG